MLLDRLAPFQGSERPRRRDARAAKRILVLADDPADGESFASDLSRGGYAAPTADFDHLPHLRMSPMPERVAVCCSPRLDRALDLCRRLSEWQGIDVLVVGTPGISRLGSPFHVLPAVSAVLLRPYSRTRLLEVLESELSRRVLIAAPRSTSLDPCGAGSSRPWS